jgi:hypothetical protein
MKRVLVLSGIIILGLSGLGGREERSSIRPVSDDLGLMGAGVSPAVLYSDANTAHLWQSAEIMTVVARKRRATRRVVVRRRKFSHSAAIVGGSAAAGAGIGALAGGGKGAIVGGLVGGGAGYVYDRKTHKKKVVVPQ